jgi:hypothetical protein
MRIFWRDMRPMVDWGYLGERRFTTPFFGGTVGQCVRHPADMLFRHQTSLESLGEIAGAQPGVRPTGFIFHISRCGSTLISQMLAASAKNIVISEASPIDTILRAQLRDANISDQQRLNWLRWIVQALGWRRHPEEQNLFIKFDSWHALFLPFIQRAFPSVPWIFLFREPLEVMASQISQRGAQMIPGVLEPAIFGWDAPAVGGMGLNEYGARALAKICESALAQVQGGNGALVNYLQLPGPVWPALMQYWGVEFTPEESRRMMAAARLNAKNPVLPFEEDTRAKRERVSPEIRALTRQWLEGIYSQLETLRLDRRLR